MDGNECGGRCFWKGKNVFANKLVKYCPCDEKGCGYLEPFMPLREVGETALQLKKRSSALSKGDDP